MSVSPFALTMPSENKSSCLQKSSYFSELWRRKKIGIWAGLSIASDVLNCEQQLKEEDFFYCLSTALEDLDILLELYIFFNLGSFCWLLLQHIHNNQESLYFNKHICHNYVISHAFFQLFLHIELVFTSLIIYIAIIECVLKEELYVF